MLARGVLAVLFAVPALLWPDVTTLGLAAAFALYAVLAAAVMVRAAITHETDPYQPRGASLIGGIVTALAGLLSVLWPHFSLLALAMVVGAWAIAVGLPEVTAALGHLLNDSSGMRRRVRTAQWLVAVAGTASTVAGIVVLLRPEAGPAALATVLGVYALIAGVLFLTAAWCLRANSVALNEAG